MLEKVRKNERKVIRGKRIKVLPSKNEKVRKKTCDLFADKRRKHRVGAC